MARSDGKLQRFRYDVFLSHSSDDREVVGWLEGVLRKYWIPWRWSRRVFLDTTTLSAGPLSDRLKEALEVSRFLIVCCSESATKSDWVDQEIEYFVGTLGREAFVLACDVGPYSAGERPPSLVALERKRGNLQRPSFADWKPDEPAPLRRTHTHNALGLLAPVAGLPDKEHLLRRRGRFAFATATLFLLSAIAVGVFLQWRQTPEGWLYRTKVTLRSSAALERVEDMELIWLAQAFGRMGDDEGVRIAARFVGEKLRPGFLAIGAAAWAPPRCAEALGQLEAWGEDYQFTFERVVLLVARSCPGVKVERIRPPSPETKEDWIGQLIETGHITEAIQLLEKKALEASRQVELRRALAGVPSVAVEDFSFVHQVGADEFTDVIIELATAGRCQRTELQVVLDHGEKVLRSANPNLANGTLLWELSRVLGGCSALGGDAQRARAFLRYPDTRNRLHKDDYSSLRGFAWHGLTLLLLGDSVQGHAHLAEAQRLGLQDIPASRTWLELRYLSEVYILLGDWPEAFRVAGLGASNRERVLHRAWLVQEYAERGRSD